MVGMVGSMIYQLSDINVDKAFLHLYSEGKLKNEKVLYGKTFQINLGRNDNQSASIFCGDKCVCMNSPSPPSFFIKTQCSVGSPDGKHFKNVSNLSHSTTQTVVFVVYKRRGITAR